MAKALGAVKVDIRATTILKMYAERDPGFGELVQSNRFTGVLHLGPQRFHERLVLQQGEFLCPLNIKKTFSENLTELDPVGAAAGRVLKIIIPNTLRPFVLDRLRDMNISRATLFPGLEGFVQSLRHVVVGETPAEISQRALLSALRSFDGAVSAALHETGDYSALFHEQPEQHDASTETEKTPLLGTILGTAKPKPSGDAT